MKSLIFFIILLLFLCIYALKSSYLPTVYRYLAGRHGRNDNIKILVLSGTHGNETNVSGLIKDWFDTRNLHHQYYVVPWVNRYASIFNIRSLPFQIDINRGYPSKDKINRFIISLIKKVDLVIDIHEAINPYIVNKDLEGLGQTIYSTNPQLTSFLISELREQWQGLETLPYVEGTLDEFCKKNEIPYVLIEILGQKELKDKQKNELYTILETIEKIKRYH